MKSAKKKKSQLDSEALEPQIYNSNYGILEGQTQKELDNFTDEETQIQKG